MQSKIIKTFRNQNDEVGIISNSLKKSKECKIWKWKQKFVRRLSESWEGKKV